MENKKGPENRGKWARMLLSLTLIILAVLILIFLFWFLLTILGVREAGPGLSNPCIAAPGFSCSNLKLNQTGKLSFKFAQSINTTMYNIELACAAKEDSLGYPSPLMAFGSITQNGSFSGATIPYGGKETGVALQLGQNLTIHNLTCYGMNDSPLYSGMLPIWIGTRFIGHVWMNFTENETPPSASNPWLTARFADMDVKVT